MYLIEIVTLLALFQYIFFAFKAGQARGKYGVKAPAVTGHEQFERHYRVQMNTLELLVGFVPALWIAGHYVAPAIAAGLGVIFLIGRMVFARAYAASPDTRTLGFLLSLVPILLLMIIGLVGVVIASFS